MSGPFDPCPINCECRGIVPGICTRCFDPNRDISTQCEKCVAGYSMHPVTKQCLKGVPSQTNTEKRCPYYCLCNGFVPWTCTRCSDIKKTVESKCRNCMAGYILNYYTGKCISTSSCPEGCICDGIIAGCARCSKPGFDAKTNCTRCMPGYSYFYSNMYGYSECRPICMKGCDCKQPGGCDGCKDSLLAVLETNCTTCKPGYYMRPDGICTLNTYQPIGGGVTSQPDPTQVDGFPAVNNYVLSQHPELMYAKVTKVSTQIVAGTSFYITYETATTVYNVVVWQKTWENFIQITSFTSTPK